MALPELTAESALIFRITHRDNLAWILDNGVHCRNSNKQDPNFVNIGLVELIDKRRTWPVPVKPHGTLGDYVPFYFTPRSIMAYNIHTGRNVQQRDNEQIMLLVTSLARLREKNVPFAITDRHACASLANYYNTVDGLKQIDWKILRASDFSRDNDDPDKTNRYMAEALVHQHMPIDALLYLACCDDKQRLWAADLVSKRKLNLEVHTKRGWYF
ncbi:hypothetical protein IP86_07845 [Rhodopseudomonas sp. AAP120]|uniref:type II toxin-antitoxin system toxin DNA ADP-ribosyl transferase DarT n=1 Tax=Rhodopseudomonas sp. AAP120 TaxID=1523430 RepID=UPI0006B9B948|nr:DUF4433 domain-containing protein [Rhodopseudomonas sp. AAP120]KPG00030.1 hypothetical protein IP86_07845 [Rhodopseudomonas sp. AAP120]